MKNRTFCLSLLVLLFIISFASNFAFGAIPASERQALIDLYNTTNGDNWIRNSGWKTPPLYTDGFALPGTENSWYGIRLGPNGIIDMINLQNNNLNGTLPDVFGNFKGLRFLYLNGNKLTGNIPSSIASVSTLEDIRLNNNQLTGAVPTNVNALTNLRNVDLSNNQLSGGGSAGNIDLSNLSNLQSINISRNAFTFRLPSWIGSLNKLTYINLSNNKLTGGIPPEMGNLTNLQSLYLNYNLFEGELPATLMQLQKLTTNTDIGNNALYSNNAELVTFLNTKDPDWQATQTIAPKNVRVSNITGSTLTLNWNLIPFTDKTGGYDVYYSTTPGGPYARFSSTANKLISSMIVTGLQPATMYYFVVKTRTIYDPGRIVESGFSNEVSATTAQ